MSLLPTVTVAADPAPEFATPTSAPLFAKAYLTQPSAAVPRALLLLEMVVVMAPVLVMPVTVVAVPPTAQPRSVLFVMPRVAPVATLLMPTCAVQIGRAHV